MATIDARTRRRAEKAKEKIRKMIDEQTKWQGKAPTVVRVTMSDYLALVEVGYVRDGELSGSTGLQVKPG